MERTYTDMERLSAHLADDAGSANVKVARVHHERGSTIEPPLDPEWPPIVKLRWRAAVVRHDTGLAIEVHEPGCQAKDGTPILGTYGIMIGTRSVSSFDYASAWAFLGGVELGALSARG